MRGKVTILIFSGIPNPQWEVDARFMARLDAHFRKLKPGIPFEAQLPPLGYRGIEVTVNNKSWLSYKQMIRYSYQNKTVYGQDMERKIQEWIISSAPENILSQEVLQMIRL